MSLSIGIVGLPNVGKSTLFNALLKRQAALAANYPFATIEPNIGVVDVPDENLAILADYVKKEYTKPGQTSEIPERIVPATVKFVDIAGLVKGASEGEGLGNKFLSHIREVDAIVHVVRAFNDTNVIREGSVNPEEDRETINTELILSDLMAIQTRIEKHAGALKKDKSKENIQKMEIYERIKASLDAGKLANTLGLSDDEKKLVHDLHLLTIKPMIYVHNIDENDLLEYKKSSNSDVNDVLYLSAKIEAELSVLDSSDQKEYMKELGIDQSGLDRVINRGFDLLGLQTFYTAGPKEVRAWNIRKDTKAPQAAGEIHTDFEKAFIKAKIISFADLVSSGGFKNAKDKGMLRLEGKDYIMRVGDIVEFMVNA